MRKVYIILAVVFITACKNRSKDKPAEQPSVPKTDSTVNTGAPESREVADTVFLSLSAKVLTSIKNNDYQQFARFVHPIRGVRFSPYAFIDTVKDIVLLEKRIVALSQSREKLTWGVHDGSGEPITLTLPDYFKKFVYDADFLNPKEKGVNRFIGAGNSLNNLKSVYGDCDFAEFYFPGFNPQYEGMDWKTLRLVFKKEGDVIYLVGVVHDQWTI